MKALKNKLSSKNGFTLVEMLIVVAIIAILIAISIPLINSALEKARDATDDANRRDAVSVATVYYLTHMNDSSVTFPVKKEYKVNNSQGSLDGTGTAVKTQCTGAGDCSARAHDKANLYVYIAKDGTVTTSWDGAAWTDAMDSATVS